MDLEVVVVPEHEVAPAVAVVVHRVDTALGPGVVAVSVGSVDPAHVRGRADPYGVGEGAVAGLDEHPKPGGVRNDQVVAAVVVQVPREVDMRDFALARRPEVGRDRHQRVFGPPFGVEPVQAAGLVGDQPVASADVREVDEPHFGTQREVETRHPGAVGERVDAQPALVILIDAHDGKLRDPATEKEPCEYRLALHGVGHDLVLVEGDLLPEGHLPLRGDHRTGRSEVNGQQDGQGRREERGSWIRIAHKLQHTLATPEDSAAGFFGADFQTRSRQLDGAARSPFFLRSRAAPVSLDAGRRGGDLLDPRAGGDARGRGEPGPARGRCASLHAADPGDHRDGGHGERDAASGDP